MDASHLFWHLIRFVALWAIAASQAFSGTIDPNVPDAKYVEFGRKFSCVVMLRAECLTVPEGVKVPEGKRLVQWGSAVIIRPHWILTAAHVVIDAENHHIVINKKDFPLRTIIKHPDFDEEKMGYFDLALGYSPQDFALEFYCPLYTAQDELNQAVTIAGYGITGTFATGGVNTDNLRRAGHSQITGIEHNVLVCRPKRGRKFPLEFLITPGDSGGGLFIGNSLAGINSFLLAADGKPDGTYTDEGAHTRISLYADWINQTIEQYEAEHGPQK